MTLRRPKIVVRPYPGDAPQQAGDGAVVWGLLVLKGAWLALFVSGLIMLALMPFGIVLAREWLLGANVLLVASVLVPSCWWLVAVLRQRRRGQPVDLRGPLIGLAFGLLLLLVALLVWRPGWAHVPDWALPALNTVVALAMLVYAIYHLIARRRRPLVEWLALPLALIGWATAMLLNRREELELLMPLDFDLRMRLSEAQLILSPLIAVWQVLAVAPNSPPERRRKMYAITAIALLAWLAYWLSYNYQLLPGM